jgi:5-methylcytosine-specific restriction endonuclease McrA
LLVIEHIDGWELIPKHEAKKRFRNAVLDHFNHHCAYCFEPLGRSPTLDHVVPKAKGGNSELNNLVACCFGCNMSKGHKDWRVWYRSLPFWSEVGEARIMDWITQDMDQGEVI